MQISDVVQPLANAPRHKKKATSAKTPEGRVKQRIKEILDGLDCYYFMPVTTGYSRSGVPDFVACVKGVFVGIEAKSIHTTHGVTKLQEKNLQEIADAGGISMEIDEGNVENIPKYLKNLAVCIMPAIEKPKGLYIKLNNQD